MRIWLAGFIASVVCAMPCIGKQVIDGRASRLYAMDCGLLTFTDLSMFSSSGAYDHQAGSLIDGCFLIRHPKGYFLWDTGLGDALVGHDVPPNQAGISLHVQTRIGDELAAIGLKPADIGCLGFSHFHADHTGNANLFDHATWIINQADLHWALGTPTPPIVDLDSFSRYRSSKNRMISGDYDVFGDGALRIIAAPGHTPGHQVLLVRLAHAGYVILTGDLYHMESDRPVAGRAAQVMNANTDRSQALASMQRVEQLADTLHARMVVQHDMADFKALPQFPAYLD